MLNRYPLWKYLLILIVLVVGLIYALPNLFPEDPAVQIGSARSDVSLDERQLERLRSELDEAGIDIKRIEQEPSGTLIRLQNADQQLAARDIVNQVLGEDYT
ncbi:protein translocase subunit SecD, partial [Halomonas sp. BBD48]|nr:protein translocase subunit SecD [Halomonas sp. BBD48]